MIPNNNNILNWFRQDLSHYLFNTKQVIWAFVISFTFFFFFFVVLTTIICRWDNLVRYTSKTYFYFIFRYHNIYESKTQFSTKISCRTIYLYWMRMKTNTFHDICLRLSHCMYTYMLTRDEPPRNAMTSFVRAINCNTRGFLTQHTKQERKRKINSEIKFGTINIDFGLPLIYITWMFKWVQNTSRQSVHFDSW